MRSHNKWFIESIKLEQKHNSHNVVDQNTVNCFCGETSVSKLDPGTIKCLRQKITFTFHLLAIRNINMQRHTYQSQCSPTDYSEKCTHKLPDQYYEDAKSNSFEFIESCIKWTKEYDLDPDTHEQTLNYLNKCLNFAVHNSTLYKFDWESRVNRKPKKNNQLFTPDKSIKTYLELTDDDKMPIVITQSESGISMQSLMVHINNQVSTFQKIIESDITMVLVSLNQFLSNYIFNQYKCKPELEYLKSFVARNGISESSKTITMFRKMVPNLKKYGSRTFELAKQLQLMQLSGNTAKKSIKCQSNYERKQKLRNHNKNVDWSMDYELMSRVFDKNFYQITGFSGEEISLQQSEQLFFEEIEDQIKF